MTIPESEIPEFLDDLKSELNITSGEHDAELRRKLKSAYKLAVGVAGVDMYPGTATEIVSVSGVLRHHPVTAVTASSYLGVDYLSTTSISESGVVTGVYTGTSVTYAYGQDEPDDGQREGILLIAAHLWQTQRAPTAGPLDDSEGSGLAPGFGFAVPDRAKDQLVPSRGGSGIA